MTRATYHPAARRGGFTLVELLVVIAIIAILVSLTAAAVIRVLSIGPDVQAHTEMGMMQNAIESAKADLNNVPFLPSRIVLDEGCNYTANGGWTNAGTLDAFSVAFLTKAFGKRVAFTGGTTFIDWNGNGTNDGPLILEGSEALTFWLGGIPFHGAVPGCLGFSADPTNPSTAGGTRKGPYFDFKATRLFQVPLPPLGNGFFRYLDPYNQGAPYVYFTSYPATKAYASDCPTLGLYPLQATAAGPFINPTGYQIISAGKDGLFGNITSPTIWNPATGYGPGYNGSDDVANFSQALLGAAQN
jgi:prepilin-type N-terminal cleavage/methylation domain-containing protein